MPSQILHILYGEDILRGASAALRPVVPDAAAFLDRILSTAGASFRLGCQGPDLFYHNQRTRPVSLEYGTLLHRRSFGSFCAALLGNALEPGCLKNGPGRFPAYAVGFATHAFLDRVFHPYIVYKSGWVSPSRPETARYARCHAFFERILDSLMMEMLRSCAPSSWDQEAALSFACDTVPQDTVDGIIAALTATFPERAGVDPKLPLRMENAFLDASAFYRITNPARTSLDSRLPDHFEYRSSAEGRASVSLVYPERFPLDIDYLNLSRLPWSHPRSDGGEFATSAVDLYADALRDGIEFFTSLFSSFASAARVPEDAASRMGNGGLSITDRTGKPCAPSRSSPFPLDAILDEQYSLRSAWLSSRRRGAS